MTGHQYTIPREAITGIATGLTLMAVFTTMCSCIIAYAGLNGKDDHLILIAFCLLAAWTTIIAICGILFILNKTLSERGVFAFVGRGTAIATSCYGLYMVYSGRRLAKKIV
jgi:hypothetical protein